jgi:hypothetical protein
MSFFYANSLTDWTAAGCAPSPSPSWPHVPWLHGHVAAPPRTFMATLLPPSSCTAMLPPPLQPCTQLHSHGTASLAATHVATPLPPTQAMSQHTSQWDALCRCPHRSCACRIAPLTAAQHRCTPRSCMGCVGTSLSATPATSPPPSQLGTPCHCVPYSWMGHVGASLAAAHTASPRASQLHGLFAASLAAAHTMLLCTS